MPTKPLRTNDVARRLGVAVNTVRLYESLGYFPSIPRAENGYRQFSELHVRHGHVIRQVMRCTWLGGRIRETALSILTLAAAGDYAAANEHAQLLYDLVETERDHAEEAVQVVEAWSRGARQQAPGPLLRIGQAAARLDVTIDELRNWERNGLLTVPRQANGYRVYGAAEIDRLLVIRVLRRARYSTMAILHTLKRLDAGHAEHLRDILDSTPIDTSMERYPTDNWLTTLEDIHEAATTICELVADLPNPP